MDDFTLYSRGEMQKLIIQAGFSNLVWESTLLGAFILFRGEKP